MAHLVNKAHLVSVIDKLDGLEDYHKHNIKNRWLAYLVRWDNRAAKSKWKHFTLRTIVVIGGVALPALIGSAAMPTLLNIKDSQVNIIQWVAFGLSLFVGVAAAIEELFRFGETWREKRAAAEILNCEGWRYFQLVDNYKGKNHKDAYPDFASVVEGLIEQEIKDYFLVARPKEPNGIPPNHPTTL